MDSASAFRGLSRLPFVSRFFKGVSGRFTVRTSSRDVCAACPLKDELGAYEFNGTTYCRAHLPLEAPQRLTVDQTQELISSLPRGGEARLRGIKFPGVRGTVYALESKHDVQDLTECEFADGVSLNLRHKVNLDGSTFNGSSQLSVDCKSATFRNATFKGTLDVTVQRSEGSLDFSGSRFKKSRFHSVGRASAIRFDGGRFSSAPMFPADGAPDKLPQSTTFTGAKFKTAPRRFADEGRFRKLRTLFGENGDREQEGFFFTLEKRSHRLSLPWPWGFWLPRLLSCLYDWTARYGYSYGLALAWLLAIQVGFGTFYSVLLDPGHSLRFWEYRLDAEVGAFTVTQLLRPFEIFSSKQGTSLLYGDLLNDMPFALAFLAATHSVLSIVLLTLMILAVRWRFRRE